MTSFPLTHPGFMSVRGVDARDHSTFSVPLPRFGKACKTDLLCC